MVNGTTANLVIVSTVVADKAVFDKKDFKAKRIILDAIKDHVIPHVTGK